MWNRLVVLLSVVSFACAALVACGGGGGGGGSSSGGPPPTYSLGVTVSGLVGTVVIQNNAAGDRSIAANGSLTLASGLASGTLYNITVLTHPANPAQNCVVSSGSGTLTANVNVAIACANIPLALAASTPANDSAGIVRSIAPLLTFSRALDAATVTTANVTMASAAGAQPIALVAGGSSVTVTPANRLLPVSEYTLTISTAVRGAAAEQLANAASLRFTTADGQWGTPQLAEDLPGDATFPRFAFDAEGYGLAAWQQHNGTRESIRIVPYLANGVWLQPSQIESGVGNALAPRMAMNAPGTALVVWRQSDGTRFNIYGWRYSRTTGFGSVELLEVGSLGDADDPEVAIDDAGRGVAVFELRVGTRSDVWAKQHNAQGWATLQLVETDNTGSAISPHVAMGTNGVAHVAWVQDDGVINNIFVNTVEVDGAVGTPMVLDTESGGVSQPQVATDPAGNVFAIWLQHDGVNGNVWASRRAASGSWSTPQVIETAAGQADSPRLAVDRVGNAIAIWSVHDGTRRSVWANRYAVGGGWGNAGLVEQNDGDANRPHVAMDPSGHALAVWQQVENGVSNTFFSRYTVAGGWTARALVENGSEDSSVPQIAIDADGDALAIWSQIEGGTRSIFSNRFE
jgi:hypothetical protein